MHRLHPAERTHDTLPRRAKFATIVIVLGVLMLLRFTYDYPRHLLPTFLSPEDAALLAGAPVASGGGSSGHGTSYVWLPDSGGQFAALSFYADDTPPGVPMVSVGPNGSSSVAGIEETDGIRGFEAGKDELPIIDLTVSCLRAQVLGVPSGFAKAAVAEVEESLLEAMHSYVNDATLEPCTRVLRRR